MTTALDWYGPRVSGSGKDSAAFARLRDLGRRLAIGILERPALAPHARLVTETMTMRALVVAALAVPLGLVEVVQKTGHRNPSALVSPT